MPLLAELNPDDTVTMRRNRTGFIAGMTLGLAMLTGPAEAQNPVVSFPFDVQLTKPLGFRLQPGLDAPPVFPNLNYLRPPTRVRVTGATGPLWAPNTFCNVEYQGRRGFIRCDDPAAVRILTKAAPAVPAAPVPSSVGGSQNSGACAPKSTVTPLGVRFCGDVESCKAFCSCACKLTLTKWKDPKDTPGGSGSDGATSCQGAPRTGAGMISPDSPDLVPVPNMRFVTASSGVRATRQTVEGLRRLDAYLSTSPSRARYNYSVEVRSCYRPAIDDTENECNFILKAMHVLNKYPQDVQKRAEWMPKLNPNNLGLAWPGATPHSAGNACDIILVDSQGRPSFDWRVGPGSPHSSIDQRLASKMLDEAVTNEVVGGRRLNYEAWHYEWGSTLGCRCKAPECANKFWPPLGKPNCK